MIVVKALAFVLCALATVGAICFLIWSRMEGFDCGLPTPAKEQRQAMRALLRKIPLDDGRYAVRGRWGWYVSESALKAYVRWAGMWWRVPLWMSTRALRVIAMEAVTGA